MKKRILPMILAATMLTGCCYAPGYSGDMRMDDWYGSMPTMENLYSPGTPLPEDPVIETTMEAIPVETIFVPPEYPAEKADTFVDVTKYIPDIQVELPYATADNFTGQVIYDSEEVYLRYGTVAKLMEVQQALRLKGLSLKIWDAFRPASAQYKLWSIKPDPEFVANPETGYSNHTRGNTVDVTLVDKDGNELEMPSEFDDFTDKADRDYSDCSEEAAANAKMLEDLMAEYGFQGYESEWWHFADSDTYPVDEYFDPDEISLWYADCNEYINIRKEPDVNSASVGRINKDEQMTLLGWSGKMAYIKYGEIYGFVNGDYINRVP